jgi:hypothetical protein
MFIIPAFLEMASRRFVCRVPFFSLKFRRKVVALEKEAEFKEVLKNKHRSPFQHWLWIVGIFIMCGVSVILITIKNVLYFRDGGH